MQPAAASLRARLRANRPALGGAPLGNLFRAVDDATALATVDAARAAGTSYVDTAPHYGHGLSERRVGAALRTVERSTFLLSTKVGRLLRAQADAPRIQHGYVDLPPFVQHYDYTGAGIRRSLEDSLQRLGMAQVDIAYVHDVDVAAREDAHHLRDLYATGLAELARMKEERIIAAYGLGVNDVAICLDVLSRAELDILLLAGRYTLADQDALEGLLPACAAREVAVVLGGPYNSGILASGAQPADGSAPTFDYAPAPPAIVARVAAIEAVCRTFDVPLKAAALQFPRGHPAVACVLAGARTPAEATENARLARLPIPPAFWSSLRERGLVDRRSPIPDPA